MLKIGKEKTILKQGLVVIGIMLGLYIFVVNPFLREGSSILDEELERKISEIKRYIARTGSFLSKESFDKLEKEKSALEKRLLELVDFVDPEKTRFSKSSSEAGLYFIERLHGSIKGFSERPGLKDVKLPENLGFGDGLPKEGMVELLLRQLETVELVVDILLKSEGVEFSTIKPLKSVDCIEPLSKEIFYTELAVQFSIKTDTKTLVNLLVELKNKSPVVSVKEMHIKNSAADSDRIEANLVLSTFKVKRGHDLQSGAM